MVAVWLLACTGGGDPEPGVETFDTLPMAVRVAERASEQWTSSDLALSWIETVYHYGLHRLHAASDDPRWQDAYRAWLSDPPDPLVFTSSDSMSPAVMAATLANEDPSFEGSVILDAADAYLATVPRTDEGAIVHWSVDTIIVDTDEVWVDSQFMFGVYLLQRGRYDEFVEQYLLFSDLCRDPGTQLYRHAYDDGTDTNIPSEDTYWARGNAWVLIAAAELLARTEPGDPAFDTIAPLFESHVDAVMALQADDGLWHTVLNSPRGDDPLNYTETSAAALIGYALVKGTESVLEPAEVVGPLQALVDGLEGRVVEGDAGLVINGTSFGTNPGDYDYYIGIPQLPDQLLGYGATVLLYAELDGLEIP